MFPSWAARLPVARLATVTGGQPHLVPVVFCECEGAVFIPIDGKPKSGRRLRRVTNIEANPAVSLLIDEYEDDWSRLRWLRADGTATVVGLSPTVARQLREKYPQYETTAIGDTAIRIQVAHTQAWSALPRP
ncbi:MAG: TIGR03668 family PPOX class F420-dependent oxidoreductase [Gammaproteobacteria bacterium]|nr:TIGR03668 family PPOX class F420-dependent oxidoreductase [Gammaproteobacteria bacterium]MYE80797.1 TIGR03668 family PPOX class F420-dependent oxidoreductase [Gammaproteobacteria bacterium]